MPQVPYSPVPTVEPAQGGPGPINIATPIEAFGGATAKAVQGLGAELGKIGDEVFHRAIAIQQLNNDAEAKDADSTYMIAAGDLHAKYNALQGKERVDAYPQYAKDLEATRVKIAEGMSNPMSRKMYDTASRGTMARTIFNGAGAAASAQKEYVVTTATANMQLDARTVEDNPNDEELFQEKLQRVVTNARTVSAAHGNPTGSPQEELLIQSEVSKLRSQQIIGKSRIAPFEAATMLDKHKGELTQADYLKVDNTVRNQGRAVGSANIADEVFNAGMGAEGKPQKSLTDMEAEAREKAKKLNPDDPILANNAVASLRSRWNQENYAKKEERAANNAVVNGAILGGVRDERQLRQDPKVAGAIDNLPKEDQLAIPGRINRYNAAKDKVTQQDSYQELYGLSNNDVIKFLETDVTKYPLSQPDMRKLQAMQDKLRAKPTQDPMVQKFIGIMRGQYAAQMQELGVYRRDKDSPELYDKMTGAVSGAIDAWTQAHGKPPTAKDFNEQIAPQVLFQRLEPKWFGLSTRRRPYFDQDIPTNFTEGLKKDFADKGLPEPTPAELERAYNRMLMNDLFSKPKAAK